MLSIGDFAVQNGPKHCAEVLSSAKYKKAIVCLIENICAVDKHHLGTSYSAISVNSMLRNQYDRLNKVFVNGMCMKHSYM